MGVDGKIQFSVLKLTITDLSAFFLARSSATAVQV